jgi:anthranilate synthase component I
MLKPSREEFMAVTDRGQRIPIYQDILADFETPLSAYWKLAHDQEYSFLLESVTGGEQLARYSILGVKPRAVVRSKGRVARVIRPDGETIQELKDGEDPLDAVRAESGAPAVQLPDMPKFVGGAVGFLAYDFVRFLERLEHASEDDLKSDDMAMLLTSTVVVFDHAKNIIRIIALAEAGSNEAYDEAVAEIEAVVASLAKPLPALPAGGKGEVAVESNMTRESFESAVLRIKDYIGEGDCIQVVYSQRLATPVNAHPLSVYRALRSLNPSPYMFLLRLGDWDLVGASPEILVSLSGRQARVRPIAGTRHRGSSPEEDDALAADLLADEKERAEHIMLVDLGRNDLGRVCTYGSVQVKELMAIERYSHVMHIVSDVVGVLADDRSALDLLRATFPAGTVSGAPKVRAMQIIDELEPTPRGTYAGAIGYLSDTGDLDMCIAIRTIAMHRGMAYVQAGAGIVYDSVPEKEYQESWNKAQACIRAIEIAQKGL